MKGSFDRFRQIVLSQIPRLLGLGDRDPFSETYGCFDRVFWHYRLIDFPNARFQEACWPLSLLYRHSFEGNLYYQNEKVRQWTEAAIRFWASHRHRDGSLDEAYPNERGFCVTAFSTFAVTEAMLLLQIRVPNLEKTGQWLLGHDQPFVANQMAVSAVALLNLYQLTNEKRYLRASQERISTLLSSQDETGFFPEYGGADIGYLSLTLACLAHYWRQTKEGPLWESMGRALKFLEERVEEDGYYDYRQTSRKTQFLYSYGLAISDSPLLGRLLRGLEQGTLLNPVWLDDRYFIQLTTDYLETYLLSCPKENLADGGGGSWESRR